MNPSIEVITNPKPPKSNLSPRYTSPLPQDIIQVDGENMLCPSLVHRMAPSAQSRAVGARKSESDRAFDFLPSNRDWGGARKVRMREWERKAKEKEDSEESKTRIGSRGEKGAKRQKDKGEKRGRRGFSPPPFFGRKRKRGLVSSVH